MLSYLSAAAAVLALSGAPQSYAPRDDSGPQRVAPRGSFAQSCSGGYVNQGRLYADCRDIRGNRRGTSIELARCSDSDIANDDGLLVCRGVRGSYEDRGNGGGWGGGNGNGNGNGNGGWNGGNGSGRGAAITVYRDADFRGRSITFENEIPNLANSGFNDQISAMELRGTWEVCSDRNYRGQCRVFRGDVRNLDREGLNDSISSLRPVRGGGRD